LTFGGTTGLALRGGAEISISNPDPAAAQSGGYRPWGADADAMLFLGGLGGGATVFSRTLAPYLFAGIGMTGGDSAGTNVVRHGWSYGVGASIPLGFDADIFAESRWRMPQYVLPTSHNAPESRSELRFGLSFHVGGGGSAAPPRRAPRRRYEMETAEVIQQEPQVVTVAPAPQPVVVMQEPAPAPQPVVVVQEPAPAPQPRVVVIERERSRPRHTIIRSQRPIIIQPTQPQAQTQSRPRGTRAVITSRRGDTRPARPIVVEQKTSPQKASPQKTSTASSATVPVKRGARVVRVTSRSPE